MGIVTHVNNRPTDKRYVISTIEVRNTGVWQTAVFRRGFGLPRSSHPELFLGGVQADRAHVQHELVEVVVRDLDPGKWEEAKWELVSRLMREETVPESAEVLGSIDGPVAAQALPEQKDFCSEFGFLPPELLFKIHEFVRAYHAARGSGWLFVRKAHIRAARSGYLSDLERKIVLQGRAFQLASGVAALSLVIAILWNFWFLIFFAAGSCMGILLARRMKFNLIQERTLIIAIEMLATDFAGWGTHSPLAREEAERWLDRIGFDTEIMLLDAYLPAGRRLAFANEFRPSEETGRGSERIEPHF